LTRRCTAIDDGNVPSADANLILGDSVSIPSTGGDLCPVLELRGVSVVVDGHQLLHDVNLMIRSGECHALLGPNASGKTALLKAIMGLAGYEIESGEILLFGRSIARCETDERARRGIGLFFQRPPPLHGLTLDELVQISEPPIREPELVRARALELGCAQLLDRDLDDDLSGGETKLAELFQLVVRAPTLCLIDEPDAGVDADNIKIIGSTLAGLLADSARTHGVRAAIIISHSGRIFDFVRPTTAHVLQGGSMVHSDDVPGLLKEIKSRGYRNLTP
jgi:Fe-S cluster assembly ATP-binding protein